MLDEEIWEEPEHLLNPDDLYGSDKMYGDSKCFSIYSVPEPKSAFGLHLRDGRLEKAGKLLLKGKSITNTSKRTNICRNSVLKLFVILSTQVFKRSGGKILCDCGKESTHSGSCLYRKKDKSKNIILSCGSVSIKPNIEILDCGCYVEKRVGARIIGCESEDCCFDEYCNDFNKYKN